MKSNKKSREQIHKMDMAQIRVEDAEYELGAALEKFLELHGWERVPAMCCDYQLWGKKVERWDDSKKVYITLSTRQAYFAETGVTLQEPYC